MQNLLESPLGKNHFIFLKYRALTAQIIAILHLQKLRKIRKNRFPGTVKFRNSDAIRKITSKGHILAGVYAFQQLTYALHLVELLISDRHAHTNRILRLSQDALIIKRKRQVTDIRLRQGCLQISIIIKNLYGAVLFAA